MKRLIRHIKASIMTIFLAPTQKSKRKAVRKLELEMIKLYPEPMVGPFIDFPGYEQILAARKSWFIDYIKSGAAAQGEFRPIMIGDSIGDGARKWMFSIDGRVNFAQPGFWIHHMRKLYFDMKPLWDSVGYNPDVFIIETPGGNNLLQRQEVNNVIMQFIDFLDVIRADYPAARIIIGDLPTSIVNYVIYNKPKITELIYHWVQNDGNSCLLCLVNGYINKLLPRNDMSLEGVHMTPLGSIRLDDEISKAMRDRSINIIG